MHLALALTVLVSALDPASPVSTVSPAAVAPVAATAASATAPLADPCAARASLPPEPLCEGAALCSARDRLRVTCELRDAFRARYVFLEEKRRLLGGGFDAAARLDGCVAAEAAIAREDEPLHFYDRVRACLGGFQDGHLIVSAPERLPQVALGIGLRRAGGKVVVASREPGLRALVGEAAVDGLPIGAEVVEIDGLPAADAVAFLAREVPGSSAAARRARAMEALTRRDFAYPERRTATLVLALAGGERRTVELPWFVSPGGDRHPLARGWARRVGLPSSDRLPWFDDAARPRRGAALEGTAAWSTILPPQLAAGLREYTDDAGRVAVRLGAVEHGVAQPFCYVQVLTFHTERLTGPGSEGRRPFAEVLTDFVRGCGGDRRAVVLDLRRNEGGYLDHSTALAEALAPRGAADPATALLLRATERNEAVYRERAAEDGGHDDVLAPRHVLDALAAARRGGQPLTPGFVAGRSFRAGGYPGRVVALTSPACMSACDRLAALLEASGRAVLVGSPTEGAGGSQQETPSVPARWTDSARLLSVSIPNAAFGVRHAPAGVVMSAGERANPPPPGGAEVPVPVFFESFGIENHPVEPRVRYDTTLEDVTEAGRGWLHQVDAILSGSPLA
jgi:hypothetical protein